MTFNINVFIDNALTIYYNPNIEHMPEILHRNILFDIMKKYTWNISNIFSENKNVHERKKNVHNRLVFERFKY